MPNPPDRILTTHAGSLPRPAALAEMLGRVFRGDPVDQDALESQIRSATAEVVRKQAEAGIDIGNDGEQARESFFTYVQHRMTGFGGQGGRPSIRDMGEFPTVLENVRRRPVSRQVNLVAPPKNVGPVAYSEAGQKAFAAECEAFEAARSAAGDPFVRPFMTSASPGIVACAMQTEHYPSRPAYIDAVAEALRAEYQAIAARGYVLQIDGPDLAMERHTTFAHDAVDVFVEFVDTVIAAINRAIAGIPREQVRLHVCWGNYDGPHIYDVPLEAVLPSFYRANVGALMLSMANPRHAHEYRVFERMPLPDGMDLIAGVIESTTNYVEHPEVVADRLERVTRAVGDPARVLAGTDCGFDTSAGFGLVAEEVVWMKLRAMREGADLAAKRLLA